MELVVVSDTHGELTKTLDILRQYPNMDGYFHLGDVGYEKEYIPQFTIVKGNHDQNEFVKEAVFEFEGFRTLLVHGDCFGQMLVSEMAYNRIFREWEDCLHAIYDQIVSYAKKNNYQAVFFGHTHTAFFQKRDGIYLCNPGSLLFSHDGKPCSYAIVHINKSTMTCEHKYIEET